MGIYDREYYRSSRGWFLDSIQNTGQVCKWLIVINVVVYVVQLFTRPVFDPMMAGGLALPRSEGPVTDFLMLDVNQVLKGEVWRLLTYAFLHSPEQIFHIVFNMLFLWWFGSEVESIYGSREFLVFYLVSAVLGGIAFTAYGAFGLLLTDPKHATDVPQLCYGASGAVTAVMVVYACHFPSRLIYLFFFLPVPIWLFVGFQVFQDAFMFLSNSRTGTAVTVHLGGALFGFVYYRLGWRLSPLFTGFRLPARRSKPRARLRVYREEEPAREAIPVAPSTRDVDEQLEAKLDAVLEKIKTSGQQSLTESERQLLLRASEIYKQRRSSKEGV
jgi:membrane associated rhomboid family serine protease